MENFDKSLGPLIDFFNHKTAIGETEKHDMKTGFDEKASIPRLD